MGGGASCSNIATTLCFLDDSVSKQELEAVGMQASSATKFEDILSELDRLALEFAEQSMTKIIAMLTTTPRDDRGLADARSITLSSAVADSLHCSMKTVLTKSFMAACSQVRDSCQKHEEKQGAIPGVSPAMMDPLGAKPTSMSVRLEDVKLQEFVGGKSSL